MQYHYFQTKAEADTFLATARDLGFTGYYVGVTCGEHEVRVWGR